MVTSLRASTRILVSLAGLALASAASAGVLLTYETRDESKKSVAKAETFIDGKRLRLETEGRTLIWRGDEERLWVVDPADKSYVEVTRVEMEQVGALMDDVRSQLAALGPEERAMVEQMMKGRGGSPMAPPPSTPAVTVRATGKTQTINGFPTRSYDVLNGDRLESEAWVAEWSATGLARQDFDGLTTLAEFVQKLAGPQAQGLQGGLVQKYGEGGLPGVPIRAISGTSVHEITMIRREDVPASKFDAPAGFRKKSMLQN